MPSDRHRILELALESLENRKKQIDQEIAEITRELRGGAAGKPAAQETKPARKRARFTKEERLNRSLRMKAYWDKKKSRRKEKA